MPVTVGRREQHCDGEYASGSLEEDADRHRREHRSAAGDATHLARWWVQMSYYATAVSVVALGLAILQHSKTFPVDNFGVYVCALTFLNLAFIVRLDCIAEAPRMRGFLHRMAFNSRRVASIAAEDGAPSAASLSGGAGPA